MDDVAILEAELIVACELWRIRMNELDTAITHIKEND
jgi:hypothetical protein